MRVYWWTDVPNFGDALTPIILQRLSSVEPEWAPIEEAELIVVGSVLDALPPDWGGTILGAGKIRPETVLDLSTADVRALRGPLTWADSGAPTCAYGDPGLLAPMLITLPERRFETAVLPSIEGALPFEGTVVGPHTEPLEYIEIVAQHKRVVTSSLHGLILADALGIPRRWEPATDSFKFDDYAAAIGTTVEPHVWTTAPREGVEAAQRALLAELERL